MATQTIRLKAVDENAINAFHGWARGLPHLSFVIAGERPGPYRISCSFEGTVLEKDILMRGLPRGVTLADNKTTD